MARPTKSSYVLEINGVKFTQRELDYLKDYCDKGISIKGNTIYTIAYKIQKAKPDWKISNMRSLFFKFVYGEGLLKL